MKIGPLIRKLKNSAIGARIVVSASNLDMSVIQTIIVYSRGVLPVVYKSNSKRHEYDGR
jgi:hypothetical protein